MFVEILRLLARPNPWTEDLATLVSAHRDDRMWIRAFGSAKEVIAIALRCGYRPGDLGQRLVRLDDQSPVPLVEFIADNEGEVDLLKQLLRAGVGCPVDVPLCGGLVRTMTLLERVTESCVCGTKRGFVRCTRVGDSAVTGRYRMCPCGRIFLPKTGEVVGSRTTSLRYADH